MAQGVPDATRTEDYTPPRLRRFRVTRLVWVCYENANRILRQ
jgi:hypothetical protein